MSPFMEHAGGQSPKVFASTKGAPVIFYGTSRWLLAKGVSSHDTDLETALLTLF
jgi:hypothetical protein